MPINLESSSRPFRRHLYGNAAQRSKVKMHVSQSKGRFGLVVCKWGLLAVFKSFDDANPTVGVSRLSGCVSWTAVACS